MPKRSAPRAGKGQWPCLTLFTSIVLFLRCRQHCVALETIETKVDRDGDVLVIEDILEGFGSVPVSVDFSPISDHMFIAFKAGEVRIYPNGGDTEVANMYDSCIAMEEEVYANNDLGLLNFRLHPKWPETAYAYMLYAHDPGYDDDCLVEPMWCEKDHRFSRIEVSYDNSTGTVTCGENVVLLNDWCTGSNHHGGGGMDFLSTGDMVLSVGDLSKADQRDPGDEEENTCFKDDIPLPQGNFRAQRDEFNEGKLLRITAGALVKTPLDGTDADSGFLERDEDFFIEAKGFRNPFRISIAPGTGDVIVADVGLDTLESIKVVSNPVEDSAASSGYIGNHGWPCIEGDAWIPPFTNEWLVASESTICDSVRGTTNAQPFDVDYEDVKKQALAGNLDWEPPKFTYRSETMDKEYPEMCTSTQASVAAVYFYESDYLPDRYKNSLFVGDYSKSCVFYFDTNSISGAVDWSEPHVLFEGRAIVDFNTDPKTGILYMIDAQYSILLRITVVGGGSSPGPDVVLEADVTSGPVPLEVTLDASGSSDDSGIINLFWDCDGDGVYEAENEWTTESVKTHVCTYAEDGQYEATVQAINSANGTTVDFITIAAGDAKAISESPTPGPSEGTSAPVLTPSPVVPPMGSSLSSPPELEWKLDESNGVFHGELEMDVVTLSNFWGETTTRGYNGRVPGPTIRMEACHTYHLRVTNALQEPNPGGEFNTMRDPNTTNIHTHGVHISGESPADNVVFVEIAPEETHTYEYVIPCDHAGGTFWYHPHHHGAVSLQMGGGAMGALIIEDRVDVHDIPDQISQMPELIMAIQEMSPSETKASAFACGDSLFNTTATSRHYLVNGEVFPTIFLTSGKWTRFRIAFAGHGNNHAFSILDPEGVCEMAVLAKDGVYLAEVPREATKLFFTPASRVDVAVRCSSAGEYELEVETALALGETTGFASLVVESTNTVKDDALEVWKPCRPFYLEDLVSVNFTEADTLGLTVRETIGGEPFRGPHDILLNMTVDEVQQWNLMGSEQHPFHMHINHMQYVEVDGPLLVPGWNQIGDWVDTVSTELAVVRFRTERYGGHVAMHCHVNSHSDTGVMAIAYINDGEQANEDPIARAPGTCGTSTLPGFGYNLNDSEAADTPTPTPSAFTTGPAFFLGTPFPTLFPGSSGVELEGSSDGTGGGADSSWWVAAAGGAGVGFGVLAFGAFLFFKLEKRQEKMHLSKTMPDRGETKAEPA